MRRPLSVVRLEKLPQGRVDRLLLGVVARVRVQEVVAWLRGELCQPSGGSPPKKPQSGKKEKLPTQHEHKCGVGAGDELHRQYGGTKPEALGAGEEKVEVMHRQVASSQRASRSC